MAIEFTSHDLLMIHARFKKEYSELVALKAAPNNPIADENIDEQMALCESIITKIEDAYPLMKSMGYKAGEPTYDHDLYTKIKEKMD